MQYTFSLSNTTFDAALTLADSAQCFIWQGNGITWYGAPEGHPAKIEIRKDVTCVYCQSKDDVAYFKNYLDESRDYSRLLEEVKDIPIASQAVKMLPGMRILRQGAWETTVEFILSANNNVGRIRKLTQAIARTYGKKFEIDGVDVYALPQPDVLAGADEADLRALGVGYRAPYLVKTARMVADGFDPEALRNCSYEDAHKQLVTLHGVGDKVADCIALFGLGHACAFPVDVWVARFMEKWFGVQEKNREKIALIARNTFGADAGLIQQYLFHAARMGLIEL